MIENLLNGFKKSLDQYGMDFIKDQHKLSKGLYIRISPEFEITTYIVKDSKEILVDEEYKWFQKRDFISRYIESNKPIKTTPRKIIHSNNYLTIFIKKYSVIKSSKSEEKKKFKSKEVLIKCFESYYEGVLADNLNELNFLEQIDYNFSKETFEYCKYFMINNYQQVENMILSNMNDFENYIKIFFDFDYDIYEKESKRYLIHKVFNNNKYLIHKDDELFGLPFFNNGLNKEKIFLENKTKKNNSANNNIPFALTLDDALTLYWYSLYLKNHEDGFYYQEMNDEINIELSRQRLRTIEPQNFIALALTKTGKIIIDYDVIPAFSQELSYSTMNHLGYQFKNKDGIYISKKYKNENSGTIKALESDINKYFFSNQLIYNYHSEPKEVSGNDSMSNQQKNLLLMSRDMLFDYFYKGIYKDLDVFATKYGLIFVKDRLFDFNNSNAFYEAIDVFNVYYSLKTFCKGGDGVENLQMIKKQLEQVMESKGECGFESNDSYSYAAGQVAYYLLSLSESSKKNHDMIIPMLNKKKVHQLNRELNYAFKKYAYKIRYSNNRFNQIYASILSYDENEKVNEEAFLAGYLSKNIFYMSQKEDNDNE